MNLVLYCKIWFLFKKKFIHFWKHVFPSIAFSKLD